MCKESKGELTIRLHLQDNNIKFISQHKFNDCKNINKLSFDFYLPDKNLCIEFDGRQHFASYNYFGGKSAYEKVVLRDKINNIFLLRINYKEDIIKSLMSYGLNES